MLTASYISAGNERADDIHIGGRFNVGESRTVAFDVTPQANDLPYAAITLWHAQSDRFEVTLITPSGQMLDVPTLGRPGDQFSTTTLDLKLSRGRYKWSKSVQARIEIEFKTQQIKSQDLRNWKLRLTCRKAAIGALTRSVGCDLCRAPLRKRQRMPRACPIGIYTSHAPPLR